jgi:oxygen-independent coproporphyrinogen-3 oxidase
MADLQSPGVYIHIPFCSGKCPYCDFYSVTGTASSGRFLNALGGEMEIRSGRFQSAGSLYIGGGTPSVLDPRALGDMIRWAGEIFDLQAGAEVTIEVNPEDVSPERLTVYREAGINRISIGVQSLDDGELGFLGRRHDAATARTALETTMDAGYDSTAIDLIFGFAGHTVQGWLATLERVLRLRPDHISCYQLDVKDSTPFGQRKRRGERIEQNEEIQRELFLAGSRFLTDAGYLHYEVSNFALDHGRISRHNMRYWRHTPYLGLGPSAHSFDGEKRWWNVSSVESYCGHLDEGRRPVSGFEELSPDQLRIERLMLGLRTSDGVPLDLIGELEDGYEKLGELSVKSLVRIENDRIVPTIEGFLMADRLPLLFL